MVNCAEKYDMKITRLREPLPEDALSELEHAHRVSEFRGFDLEMRSLLKEKGIDRQRKAAAEHLSTYIQWRLKLLEKEWRYAGYRRRVLAPRAADANRSFLQAVWGKPRDLFVGLIAKESRIAIWANNWTTRMLVETINREAAVVDRMLNTVGVERNSDLRPASCLPGSPSDLHAESPQRSEDPGDGRAAPACERGAAPDTHVQPEIIPFAARIGPSCTSERGRDVATSESPSQPVSPFVNNVVVTTNVQLPAVNVMIEGRNHSGPVQESAPASAAGREAHGKASAESESQWNFDLDLNHLPERIKIKSDIYPKDGCARYVEECDSATDKQRICAALRYVYDVPLMVIADLLGVVHKTVQDHIAAFDRILGFDLSGVKRQKKRAKYGMDGDQLK